MISPCQISRQTESHTCWVGIWRAPTSATLSLRRIHCASIQFKTLQVYWSRCVSKSGGCLLVTVIPTEGQPVVPAWARSPAGFTILGIYDLISFPLFLDYSCSSPISRETWGWRWKDWLSHGNHFLFFGWVFAVGISTVSVENSRRDTHTHGLPYLFLFK